jgi:integrase
MDMVRHYADKHAVENNYDLVFPSFNGRWQCRRNWQRRGFNVACMEAGLVTIVDKNGKQSKRSKYRPYDLRHFFASMLIEKNINLKKMQNLMGHTNIETTLNVYGHLLDEDKHDENIGAGMLSGMLLDSCGESVASVP